MTVKTGWLAVAGGLAVAGLSQPACDRTPAKSGAYEWTGAGQAGGGEPATEGGASGVGGAADGGAGLGGEGSGATGPGSTGGSATSTGGAGATAAGGSGDAPVAGGSGDAPNGDGGRAPQPGGAAGRGGDGGAAGDPPDDGGAGGIAPFDPCADAADTDEDGVNDPCDDDDDDDGYVDGDDRAPKDPFAPGGRATPGTIVNDACVKDVLAKLELLGMTMPIHRKMFPPNMNGYFVRGEREGTILAADDGVMVGAPTTGMEARVFGVAVDRFDSAVVDFSEGKPTSYGVGHNGWMRGFGNDFTHFGGSGGLVLMYSARRGGTGSWLDGFYLSILLPTSGMPHTVCPPGAGKYRFSDAPLTEKVEPAELDYMCVDEDAGYVQGEKWTQSDGDACECTDDYLVSCEAP